MNETISQVLAWLAPILSTLIVCAGQLALNAQFKRADEKREKARLETTEKRTAEAMWRTRIELRIDEQDEKVNAILRGQVTQMRSDLIHKAHRYLDDLGCASMDERDSFNEEYKDYCAICKQHRIKNNFVDMLHQKVMNLPDRPNRPVLQCDRSTIDERVPHV